MVNLDNNQIYQKLDRSNMLGSIELLGEQIEQTWNEVSQIRIPEDYHEVNKIVFSGMGGSALGAYVAKYLYAGNLKFPFEVINDYHLPHYVDEKTLVIIGSYSGNTEETLSSFFEAVKKRAKVIALSSGGKLKIEAEKEKIPFYQIKPKFNPCNQPRMGIGYAIFALLTFFNQLKLIPLKRNGIDVIKKTLTRNNDLYGKKTPLSENPAKQLAQKIYNKIPIFIAGEFLVGAVHAIRNQINENAKSLAVYFPLPELNHHLLEGLRFPNKINENDFYILIQSDLYSGKIKKRLLITNEMLLGHHHQTFIYQPKSKEKLVQIIETIGFGAYVGYYLALLYQIDPSPIPNVDLFKKKLGS